MKPHHRTLHAPWRAARWILSAVAAAAWAATAAPARAGDDHAAHMANHPEVTESSAHSVAEQCTRGKDLLELHGATIADGDACLTDTLDELGEGKSHRAEIHTLERWLEGFEVVETEMRARRRLMPQTPARL